MSPVEHTSTSSVAQPSSAATAAHIAWASSTPAAPVAALAQPLLSTTAAARPPVRVRCALVVTTGAAVILFWVNTAAAATGRPSVVATRLRSGSPDALIPQAMPGRREPVGRRHRHGYTPTMGRPVVSGRSRRRLAHCTAAPDGALGEVVDGGDGDHPAGALVVARGDVGAVRAEGGLGRRRAVGDDDERLVGVDVAQAAERARRCDVAPVGRA